MVRKLDLTNGIYIETPEKSFNLDKADFPTPTNLDDKFEVEEQIQAILDEFADGAFYPIVLIDSLDPLKYRVSVSPQPPTLTKDEMRH